MKTSGIYEIRNLVNNKHYIGGTVNLTKRRGEHFRQLAQGIHGNEYLQNAYDKHGKDAFVFKILLHCAKKDLVVLEQTMMDANKPEYNIFKFARSALGHKHSKETRRKLSKAALANKNHAFRFHPGHEVSEETRRKLSTASKGNKHKLGIKHTEEAKRRIGLASKNRPPPSEESRKKMSLAHMGKTLSEEHKAKISEAHKANKNHPTRFRPGQEFSEEWRHKNSQRAKKRERDSLGRFK